MTNLFLGVFCPLINLVTFGFAGPALTCMKLKNRLSHIELNGRRLVFCGTAKEIFAKNILWNFLSVVTLGIFLIFKNYLVMRWQISRIHFAGVEEDKESPSKFTGSWFGYFLIDFMERAVTLFTLSVGYYWAYCRKQQWLIEHVSIDGHTLRFTAHAKDYFKQRAYIAALSILTLGIYAVFSAKKLLCWSVAHTWVCDAENIMIDEARAAEQNYVLPFHENAQIAFFMLLFAALSFCCGILTLILAESDDVTAVSFVPVIFACASAAISVVCAYLSAVSLPKADSRAGKLFSGIILGISVLLAVAAAVLMIIALLKIKKWL